MGRRVLKTRMQNTIIASLSRGKYDEIEGYVVRMPLVSEATSILKPDERRSNNTIARLTRLALTCR